MQRMRQQAEHVQEWLQIHRQLVELETAFTDLAIRAVQGDVPPDQLQRERIHLITTRELCTAAYERAFPKSVNH
jgi:hypothetical protein